MRLNSLFRDGFAMPLAFLPSNCLANKLPNHRSRSGTMSRQKENPDACLHRGLETNTRAFSDRSRVKTIIYQVFQILARSYLPHQTIFVSIHPSQLSNVRENVLQTIRQLKRRPRYSNRYWTFASTVSFVNRKISRIK